MIGEKLGNRYEIVRLLGGGGMALVYLARDTFLDRPVAIKILRREFLNDPDFVRRFKKEAQSVASLSHPNIVNVYDLGQSEEDYYLVMEFVEGKTLKEYLDEHGVVSWQKAIEITKQICDGLEQAHERSIVHRDIKPHNILLDIDGRAKVTDFGIAQAINNVTITHNKGLLGSAHYFSPEQARGEVVGAKSDIYSLGVVLYQLVTGQLPFSGDNPVTVALKHLQEQPVPPSELGVDIPDKLERSIMKAMEKSPARRYDTIGQMRAELLEVLLENMVNSYQGKHKSKEVVPPINDQVNHPRKEDDKDFDYTLVFDEPIQEAMGNQINKQELLMEDEMTHSSKAKAEDDDYDVEEEDYEEDDYEDDGDEYEEDGVKKKAKVKEKSKKPTSKDGPTKKVQRKNMAIMIAVGFVVLCLGLFAGVSMWEPKEVEVPAVTGKDIKEATLLLEEQGLDIEITEEVFHEELPVGAVVDQEPLAGNVVKKGRLIRVTVSKGVDIVEVPDLINVDSRSAIITLENKKLTHSVTEAHSSKVPAGQIISQIPKGGKEVPVGTEIELVVSKGAELVDVSVPNLSTLTEDQAKGVILDAKLEIGKITREESDTHKEGYLIRQSVEPFKKVPQGTRVDLVISKGPGPKEGEKQATVDTMVVNDGKVLVELTDREGTRVVYEKDHLQGDYITVKLNYYGSGVVNVYNKGDLIYQKDLE